jgi:hypothetical protein
LVVNKLEWFDDNRKNRWCSGQKEDYFGCGDPDHFITNCPKLKGKSDSCKRKDKNEYTSDMHKFREGKISKEMLKKKYIKNVKAQERAFLSSLSNLELNSSNNNFASGDDESEK